jgi:Rieske Fe-S protein
MPADPELRLRLRVAIKLLLVLACGACAVVALGFVFGGAPEHPGPTRRIALDGIAPGEVRTVGYDSRPVIILHRDRAMREALTVDTAWLVAYARGTGHGCPVVWQAERRQFRESCSDLRYDAAGRALQHDHAPLEQPPHRIEGETLILGRE